MRARALACVRASCAPQTVCARFASLSAPAAFAGPQLARCGRGTSAAFISTVNVLNGAELALTALTYEPRQIVPLPATDSHGRKLLLVLDEARQFRLHPDSAAAHAVFHTIGRNVSVYSVSEAEGVIRGFTVSPRSLAKPAQPGAAYTSVVAWVFSVRAQAERIVALSSPEASGTISSPARVMPDRGVLWKALSPHLFAVATVSAGESTAVVAASSQPPTASAHDSAVRIYLLDAVTGSVLQSFAHQQAHGPVHLVQSENLLLAHFWNAAAKRYEVSVMEVLEPPELEWGLPYLYKILAGNITAFSSSHIPEPQR